jgi:5-oxoprolinase (ATP-hydrolysing) subunit A
MISIDLNCDLGEGCGSDAQLMPLISSANIACGFHAGDRATMRRTVELAIANGVAIGAHPGYPDRENFGRTEIRVDPKRIIGIVGEQIDVLSDIAAQLDAKLSHVKPHGALYNQSAKVPEIAHAIAEAVREADPELILFGLSGSVSITAAAEAGLRTAAEVFADRTYQPDGRLTPRSLPNALIQTDEDAIAQVLGFVNSGSVTAVSGEIVSVRCDTVCVHGDGANAVSVAASIRKAILNSGVRVAPPYQ